MKNGNYGLQNVLYFQNMNNLYWCTKVTRLSKKVNVKEPIDPDKLRVEKDDSFEMAYAVYIPLDSTPDHIWEQCFERERKVSFYSMKRQVTVEDDKLRVVTASNEITAKIEWIRRLVEATNRSVEEYNKEMRQKEEIEEARRKREEEDIKKMREALKSGKS